MKKFGLLLFSALVAFSISAQEVQNVSHGTVYLKNKGSDNWYIGLGGGTNLYMTKGENDAGANFGDRLGWMGQIEIGRWNSPNWGARVVIDAGHIKHVVTGLNPEQNWGGAHLDLLYNVTNAWGSYNPDRVYSLVPYLGIGYMYGLDADWKKPNPNNSFFKSQNQTLTYNVGLINNFQLSKSVALFLELGWRAFQETFDGSGLGGDFEYDSMFTGTAGIKFGLGGKQDFTPAELMDYNLINDLNSQINRLRAENEKLRLRPESCPDCPEVKPTVVTEGVYVPNVVFFRINSAKIDKGQQVSVYNTAEYLKSNPNAKVNIVAYADKQTGTPAYNFALSEKRARAVADALTNEYGISSSRISIDWKGDTEQPYAENDWNRVAIFFVD
ncbi:OmpA family protein [Proteiniphilum sp.]|uniref:OmpA family protein n=1 Tax=Proteiniphilum sp. TaxID=1926877 RepID=UPI002B1ECCBA|nr:OmpA family protein [Proteiniphilum sp.]MEA4918609.1 OmpA family protein [Proteiniphilum sp.]